MADYAKLKLSASVNGKMIKVTQSGTPGTVIHTALAGTDGYDEIWLWAINTDTTDRKLTIEWGGVTSPDDLIEYTVPAEDGLKIIVPGLVLNNSAVIRAFAATADVIMISGFVNRIA